MIPLSLEQLADVVAGELADPREALLAVDAVVIDSRKATPGTLFVPLPGEHADGHEYLADAARRGAAMLVASGRPLPDAPGVVVVDDPADALLGLGAWVRDTVDPAVVAVTGSQGKTTTKDLLAAAVGAGRRVAAAPESYNNNYGVPLTCCLLGLDTEVLVTEIGTRGLGHIAALAPLVRPDIAVVTAIGASHLELLGDLDTVALAKGELVEALGPGGVAVLNADDERVAALAARAPGRVVTYGSVAAADWQARDLRFDRLARPTFIAEGPDGQRVEVRLAQLGAHNVGNALAALAVAHLLEVPLEAAAAALSTARVSRWRMELCERSDGLVVLNDAYNANPASMRAALEALGRVEVEGRRWALLGRMAELGASSADAHTEIGRTCAELGIDGLVTVGEETAPLHAAAAEAMDPGMVHHVDDVDEAVAVVRGHAGPGDVVLVKGSRAVGLERAVAALLATEAGAAGAGGPGSSHGRR